MYAHDSNPAHHYIVFFFLYSHSHPRDLHSFPTRRSSDLLQGRADLRLRALPGSDLGETRRQEAESRRARDLGLVGQQDRKSTGLNSSHRTISYAVFCLKKKKKIKTQKSSEK